MAPMSADLRKPLLPRQPALSLASLLAVLLIAPCGHEALAATNPSTLKSTTMLKPPVQAAATGSLKTSRQALLKRRASVTGFTNRHPGKIVGATTLAPKTIVTKRFLPK